MNFKYGITGEFDYIRVLKNIKNVNNINFWKWYALDKCWLEFKNVSILIKSNKQDSIFIKWKSFIWYISINKINNDFWFTKRETNNIHDDQRFLNIANADEYNLKNWEWVFDKEELKILKHDFIWNHN